MPSTSTDRTPARCASSSIENAALLDPRVPLRWPAAGRHAVRLRRVRRARHRGDGGARAAGGLATGGDPRGRERTAARAAGRGRATRAASAWTRSGTTTCTTPPWSRLTGRARRTTPDHAGAPQELISAAKWGYLLSGPALPLAEQAPWDGIARCRARALRCVPREPRPGCELRAWAPAAPAHDPRPVPRADGADPAVARHTHALPGPGVRIVATLPVLRRSRTGARREGGHRTRRVPGPVPEPRRPRGHAGAARPPGRRHVRALACSTCASARRHAAVVALHRDLLRLRRETAAFRAQAARGVDGAVLGPEAFVLRYFDGSPGRRHDETDARAEIACCS